MDNPILNAALEYAERGWSVIPISRDKHPLIKWKTATREELTNPNNIKKWWGQYPSANVAIVTGERSGGLVVIDLDIDDEKGINGKESLNEWCDQNYVYTIESSATVATGRGGQHLYFQSGFKYHNQVGCLEGVDIRGEGGCVVAPPSIHGTTKREYVWDIEEENPIVPEADSDVIFFLGSMETKSNLSETPKEKKNDFTKITKEGGRNNQLFKYIARLQGDGESDEAIQEYAAIYNKTHLNPPLCDDEVKRTIDSVLSHSEWKGTSAKQNEPPEKACDSKAAKQFKKLKLAKELMDKSLPELKTFVGVGSDQPLLVEGTCILSAKPKLGKSWFALSICLAVANGQDFLGYKTKQCSTLYLDLETNEVIQQRRLKRALNGQPVPGKFYIASETYTLNEGFAEQIESYLQEDPDIGIIVVDVFQKIRSPAKGLKETEYEHAYRDFTPLNELAKKHHISIILVMHDRKSVDPDDPFSNILGSIGLQGATDQMIIMYRKRKGNPIHIAVKGKTIDSLPEMDVEFENAEWKKTNRVSPTDQEQAELQGEYMFSTIREAVIKLVEKRGKWEGRCSRLIDDALDIDVAIVEPVKNVGGFLHRHKPRFFAVDHIKVTIIKNGQGGSLYRFEKITVDTVDKTEPVPLIEDANA